MVVRKPGKISASCVRVAGLESHLWFNLSFLPIQVMGLVMMAQVIEFLPLMWKAWIEYTAQCWLLPSGK